jgi:hypothetical protein
MAARGTPDGLIASLDTNPLLQSIGEVRYDVREVLVQHCPAIVEALQPRL